MRLSPTLISVAYSNSPNSKIVFKKTNINPFNVLQSIPVSTSHTCNSTTLKLPLIKRKPANSLAKRNAAIYCKPAFLKSIGAFDYKKCYSSRVINASNCFPKRSSIAPICLYKMHRKSRFISPLASAKNIIHDDIVNTKDFQIKKLAAK